IRDETRRKERVSNTAVMDELGRFDAVEIRDEPVERVEALAAGEDFDHVPDQHDLLAADDSETTDDEPCPLALEADDVMGDALSLFLREIGRYPLLTAAEEVVLAKCVERGDEAAKERMI